MILKILIDAKSKYYGLTHIDIMGGCVLLHLSYTMSCMVRWDAWNQVLAWSKLMQNACCDLSSLIKCRLLCVACSIRCNIQHVCLIFRNTNQCHGLYMG
jgi:hypothetical protein